MTGGTLGHNRIKLNVYSALRTRLAGSGCEAFAFDVRVVTPRGDVMYPDVVVACGERRNKDKEVSDPVVLVEVLSDSTAARDHGYKRLGLRYDPVAQALRPDLSGRNGG